MFENSIPPRLVVIYTWRCALVPGPRQYHWEYLSSDAISTLFITISPKSKLRVA